MNTITYVALFVNPDQELEFDSPLYI